MKIVNIIGAGRIAGPVIGFIRQSGEWRLGGVLVRSNTGTAGDDATADPGAFFASPADLIIEAAAPSALRDHGERALAAADLWAVSASALADEALRASLEAVGRQHGHRLRVLAGAMAGLDGVAAASIDPGATLHLSATRPGLGQAAGDVYSGPLRDAAMRYPHEVNFAVAVALAGRGIDAASIELHDPGAGGVHRLSLMADATFGRVSADVALHPLSPSAVHPVSASIIAAMRRETQVIWAG